MAKTWTMHARLQLRGLTVELSEPVLVKRSRWFCWFPSLIRQSDNALWAIMTAYADVHVSDAFCYLTRSQDCGLTWDEPRVIGDAGLNHHILPDGGMARVCDWNHDGRDEIILLGGEGYVDLRVYPPRSESAGPSCNRVRATEVAR